MHDSAPDPEDRREGKPEVGPAPPPSDSGLTHFLVENPTCAGLSRETLIEALRSLYRERDYLRRARDLQLADFDLEMNAQKQHTEELKQLQQQLQAEIRAQIRRTEEVEQRQQREAQAYQEQAEDLKRELVALKHEIENLLRERGELLADRDAWRDRANRGFIERARRTLRGLAGRVFRSTRKDAADPLQTHSNDRTQGV